MLFLRAFFLIKKLHLGVVKNKERCTIDILDRKVKGEI